MRVIWTQQNADTQWEPNYVAATVLRVGRLVTIRTHDGFVRRVPAEKLKVRA
jgi:acetamidase/formamidase